MQERYLYISMTGMSVDCTTKYHISIVYTTRHRSATHPLTLAQLTWLLSHFLPHRMHSKDAVPPLPTSLDVGLVLISIKEPPSKSLADTSVSSCWKLALPVREEQASTAGQVACWLSVLLPPTRLGDAALRGVLSAAASSDDEVSASWWSFPLFWRESLDLPGILTATK